PPSSPRRPSSIWGVTGHGTSNLLDVRLGRAAAQDDPRGQRPNRLGQADPLGQPTAQQVGLPGRGRLPNAAGPAQANTPRAAARGRHPALPEARGLPAGRGNETPPHAPAGDGTSPPRRRTPTAPTPSYALSEPRRQRQSAPAFAGRGRRSVARFAR